MHITGPEGTETEVCTRDEECNEAEEKTELSDSDLVEVLRTRKAKKETITPAECPAAAVASQNPP